MKITTTDFSYDHLPPHLQAVSSPFSVLARSIMQRRQLMGAEAHDAALLRLWEAKNIAVLGAVRVEQARLRDAPPN